MLKIFLLCHDDKINLAHKKTKNLKTSKMLHFTDLIFVFGKITKPRIPRNHATSIVLIFTKPLRYVLASPRLLKLLKTNHRSKI